MNRPHCSHTPSTAVLVLAAALLGACGGGGPPPAETKKDEPLLVRLVRPEARDLDRLVTITAEARATLKADVGARVQGVRVATIVKDLGDPVEAGDLLCKLDDVDLKQVAAEAEVAALSAEIKVKEAEWAIKDLEAELQGHKMTVARKTQAWERAKTQAQRGAIAEEDLEAARYDLDKETSFSERLGLQIEKARVAVELAKKESEKAALASQRARTDLENVEVRAPFAGVVSARHVSPGQLTSTGQALYSLFDPSSVVIETFIPQRDLQSVRSAQRVKLRADAFPGINFHGIVDLVAPTVETNGTVMVRLRVDPAGTDADPHNRALLDAPGRESLRRDFASRGSLKPGLFVSGQIVVETREKILTVPRKAVGYQSGRPFVFLADPIADSGGKTARATRVYFEEGLGAEGVVEFVALPEARRLKAEDQVVLVGGDRLKDGDTVSVEPPSAKDGATTAPGAAKPADDGAATTNGGGNGRG